MLIMAFRIALRALARNKLRSFLTMLGIIIGVGAVIAMVAIGEGAKKRVQEQIASLGTESVGGPAGYGYAGRSANRDPAAGRPLLPAMPKRYHGRDSRCIGRQSLSCARSNR